MQVTFLPRSEVEALIPPRGYHLISISDGEEDEANIDESKWSSVSRHHFIDAGYDEETIAMFGSDFTSRFADYCLEGSADVLRARVLEIVQRREPVVVNCQAGRSRSAAVAKFISDHHGYELLQPTPDANMCVYRMLARDAALIQAYRAATTPPSTETSAQSENLLATLKRIFGF